MKSKASDDPLLHIRRPGITSFDPLPQTAPILHWPTRRRDLFTHPELYIARTRANPSYGMPGWTRDCGRRFHRGLDIAPIHKIPSGRRVTVLYSDCERQTEYPFEEDGWIPLDDVFAVADGTVELVNPSEKKSDFGLFLVIRHEIGTFIFYTLYAHLAELSVTQGANLSAGMHIGAMGQTSRSEDAKRWMAVAPHLHFEVITRDGGAYDPLKFLRAGLRGESSNHHS